MVTHPATFVAAGDLVRGATARVVDAPERTRLWRYHKPDGLVTTHRDPQGRPTVFERLPPGLPRVVSVGRLDLTSEGLLLLTNDGALARRLELPATGWLRRYRVRVHGARRPAAGWRRWPRASPSRASRYGPIEAGLDCAQGRQCLAHASACARAATARCARVMAHLGLAGDAADPHRLRPVPARHAAARRDRGGAGRVLRDQLPARCRRRRTQVQARPTVRIVAGAWRGRTLPRPPGRDTRPTADRVRQALFDMLLHAPWGGRDAVEGARVLDVFAGTGALGLEALSRGAAHAVFIERDRARLPRCAPTSPPAGPRRGAR